MSTGIRHNSTHSTLDPVKAQVVASLASGATVTAAAGSAGIHRATVYNWRRTDPDFVQACDEARREALNSVRAEMCSLAQEALGVLTSILRKESATDTARLRAALSILRYLPKEDKAGEQERPSEVTVHWVENDDEPAAAEPAAAGSVARSAPCPCGSKLKFKRCCGKGAPPQLQVAPRAA